MFRKNKYTHRSTLGPGSCHILFLFVAPLWVTPRTNNGIYGFSIFYDISRLKLGGCRDRDSSRRRILVDVKTETHQDQENWYMSIPRLIETWKICGCQNRDSSRLRKMIYVNTKNHQDLKILWMLRPRPTKNKIFCGCLDRDLPQDVKTETISRVSLFSDEE